MGTVRPQRLAQRGVSGSASVGLCLNLAPLLRGEVGAQRRVRGLSANSNLSNLLKQPLIPTFSP
jgi:hypothetical protein